MIIDQLPTIANIQNSDELPIERGQTTYKTTVGEVVGAVSKIVADEYDNTSTYAVGDYCVYEGTLYVCNTDISTAEEWNASHWTATNVTDEIPSAYTGNPAMDGTASPGSSTSWAKGDHVHPTDTSRAASDLGVSGATANQYVQITAVDTNGKPTAFGPGTPSGGGLTINVASITIAYANWSGNGPYTQTVTISGATITANTKVDLQPDATAIAQLISDGVTALYISNTSGTLTAYAIGAATTANITVQCTYYETT